MPNLFSSWMIARSIKRHGAAPRSAHGSAEELYADAWVRLDRRLRREVPLDLETPPSALRARTMRSLHDAALNESPPWRVRHRRRVSIWRSPQFGAALTAGMVVLASALTATFVFSPEGAYRFSDEDVVTDRAPRVVEHSGEVSTVNAAAAEAPLAVPDSLFATLPGPFQQELDAVARDARRAADFIVSQFSLGDILTPENATAELEPRKETKTKQEPPSLDL